MYTIIDDITEEIATEFFLSDPRLAFLGISDEELHMLHTNKHYSFLDNSHYVGVLKDGKDLVSILRYEYFTPQSINQHMYINSNYHHTSVPHEVAQFLLNYAMNTLKIYKIITLIPSNCPHALSFGLKHGFKKEGVITNCFQWRQQLVDLVIYGLDLPRPSNNEELL